MQNTKIDEKGRKSKIGCSCNFPIRYRERTAKLYGILFAEITQPLCYKNKIASIMEISQKINSLGSIMFIKFLL